MDDEASLHVIEALMAGMIILMAVLFMTATSSPSPAEGQSGLDLAKVSADTLRVLQQRPSEENAGITPNADPATPARHYPSRLDEIVDEVVRGQDMTANEAFLRELVPAGNRYQLRLDNGVDNMVLLPRDTGFAAQPRAAKAAETFIVPMWQANTVTGQLCAGSHPPAAGTYYTPGGQKLLPFDVVGTDSLTAPTGLTQVFGTTDWADWWVSEITEDGLSSKHVPRAAMYGWWIHNGSCFFIGLEGTTTEYPTYGVQLVVWPIA